MILVSNLTFSYHPREDRMIFTINHNDPTKRLDLLVTRKKLIELLNGFDEILINLCDNGKIFKELYHNQEPLAKPKDEKNPESEKEDEKTKEELESKPENTDNPLEKPKWEKQISSKELNFTKSREPILLDAVSYTRKDNVITFKFISNGQEYAASIMTCDTFQRTLSSLMRVIPFVSWGISPHILD